MPVDEPDGSPSGSFPVVGIGASAGGLEALSLLLRHVVPGTGIAYVAIQHLGASQVSHLTELLARVCALPVEEARDGTEVAPDHVYVIPAGAVLRIAAGRLQVAPRPEGRRLYLPVDDFLCSLAGERGPRAIGVVLSGTGADGTLGLQAIKGEGGVTFAQDETAQHDGMPRSAIDSGAVDFVLPPAAIAAQIGRLAGHPLLALSPGTGSVEASDSPALEALFGLLRGTTRVPYAQYKRSTIRRRIQRRLLVHGLESLESYLELTRQHPEELQALQRDLLIHVTHFFRDPVVFEALGTQILPGLLGERPADTPVRVWVPGCSTGEEVYSIAICLLEALGESATQRAVKVFATDVSEASLERARAGLYLDSVLQGVSTQRLERFFQREGGGWRINKAVRELCVFARHDMTRDPPFSNLDLISCRNVLIYLGAALQRRVLPLFHYALREGGLLVLGSSEAIGNLTDLFTPLDADHKVYARKSGATRLAVELSAGEPTFREEQTGLRPVRETASAADVQREADRQLLARYAPPGVVVDENLEVLCLRGQTGSYLALPPGAPSHSLLKLAREGLLVELRSVLEEVRSGAGTVRREGLRVLSQGRELPFHLQVSPLQVGRQHCFLVVFEPAGPARVVEPAPDAAEPRKADHLQQELAATRDYMQSIIEELEASNEELRAANEEILSSNEELQSTNEELQTAKEELQASNEELNTVNEELQERNREAAALGDDLANLLRSVHFPIVMVDRELRIRRFTPSAAMVLRLIPGDVGRPIVDIRPRLSGVDLEPWIREVLESLAASEHEVQDDAGRWHQLWIRPYRTQDDRIEGAVLAVLDVDALKRSEERLRLVLEGLPVMVAAVDASDAVLFWNHECERVTGYTKAEVCAQPAALRKLFPGELVGDSAAGFLSQDRMLTCKDGTSRWVAWSSLAEAVPIPGWGRWWLGVDVSERRRAEGERASLREKEALLREVHHRVKNNLQVILSVLDLQIATTRQEGLASVLGELQHRVQAMASLHEMLYRGDQSEVALRPYLEGLCVNLARSQGPPGRVRLDLELAHLRTDPARALPLGLLVNELVGNAYRHAFPGDRTGRILVRLEQTAGGTALRVVDDGIGLPASVDWAAPGTLGLRLVGTFVKQLGGALSVERGQGTIFSVSLPEPEPGGAS